jgi:hypothetical protein
MGFAISALLPSAATVRAARQIDLGSSGKVSNSLSAALIHETGRVFADHWLSIAPSFYVVISDNNPSRNPVANIRE